jgi:hypothetical protein
MKHPPLLPTIFVVIILGFVHVQFQGQTSGVPIKELVAIGVVLFGSGYALKTNPEDKEDVVQHAARADDDLDMSA